MEDILLSPGQIICDGRYEIVSKLGQGEVGVVYRAKSLSLKRDVAIKMLAHLDEGTLKRFFKEAEILAQIEHPAVVRTFDLIESGILGPLLVTEYLRGEDLATRLRRGPLSLGDAVEITLGVCSGVHALHGRGVLHRDIKPRNIFLLQAEDWRERVKILDFGLAIPHDSAALQALRARTTQIGEIVGEPRFAAPELLRGEEATAQCDQYSIAAVLYMASTGRDPFYELEGDDLRRAILSGSIVAPRLFCRDISRELGALIVRALALDPKRRFPSVVDFASALLEFATDKANARWTRYFSNVQRPIPRRLFEPVSAQKKSQPEEPKVPLVKRIEPLAEPLRERVPSAPVGGRPRAARPADERPAPAPSPKLVPVPKPPQESKSPGREPIRPSRQEPSQRYLASMLGVFALGSLVGAAITVAAFLLFLSYQQRSGTGVQTKEQPTLGTRPPQASAITPK